MRTCPCARLGFLGCLWAAWRMSNNINKPPYLARRQCKTTRRMRNFLVVIILRLSERTRPERERESQLFSLINWLKAFQAKSRSRSRCRSRSWQLEPGRNSTTGRKVFGPSSWIYALEFHTLLHCRHRDVVVGLKTISDVFLPSFFYAVHLAVNV